METNLNFKKIAVWLGIVLILIVIASWILHYFNTGTIIVTTNDRYSVITLKQVSSDAADKGKKFKTFTAHNKLSARVGLGQYVASVQGNSIGTMQVVKLTSHKTLLYALNPINATGVEPVAYRNAQDLVADQSNLIYLNTVNRKLYGIDNQNTLAIINGDYAFRTVQWANAKFGLGQDDAGRLYAISNGSVSLLEVPFTYDNITAIRYAVSSSKQVYVSFGPTIYRGTSQGNFRKIYTSKASNFSLVAGPTELLVNEPKTENKSDVIAINNSGKETVKNLDLGLTAWSANGKYLASATEDGGVIYDESQGESTTIPNLSQGVFISSLSWLDNNTLFYCTGDQIWAYSTNTKTAHLFANMPLGAAVTQVSVSDDHAYLYIISGGESTNTAIRRIGLRGQQVPSFIYQLQNILPSQQDTYSLSLINFTQPPTAPAILVQPYLNAPAGNYIDMASKELRADGFDINQLDLRLDTPLPGQ